VRVAVGLALRPVDAITLDQLINALLSAFRATRNKLADENYANDVRQATAACRR